ncbi:MAG TPA: hypothetical protein VF263_05640 [Longimicrobiaceae bacterium]
MKRMRAATLSLALAVVAVMAASPASAQRKDEHRFKEREQAGVRYDRRYDDRDRDGRRDRVPPGWCNGRGNPHNTAANCGYDRDDRRRDDRDRRYDDRYDRDRRYDDRRYDDRRYDSRSGRYGRYSSYASFARAHDSFHRRHDWECRDLAARRPLDPGWQIRVRSDCKRRHDDWHRHAGIRHDGRTISRW